MGFNRKTETNLKRRNLAARDDFNHGGAHGKSKKAQRTKYKQTLNQYDLDDLLEDEFVEYENEDYL